MAVPNPDPYKLARKPMGVPKPGNPVPTPFSAKPPGMNPIQPKQIPDPTYTKSGSPMSNVPKPTSVPAPPVTPQSTFSTQQYTDWQNKTNENYANLEKLTQQPFTYDPSTDAGYLAQRDLAQLRAGDATRNAMETMNERGLLQSTMTNSQLGQIQQRAEQEAASYIPEYRQQAYGQYQDRLANAGNLLNTSRQLRSDQFGEAVTEGELTGNYMSPQAQGLVDNLFNLKQQAESPDITRESRAELSRQADAIRSQLSGMGVDASQFGANVNLNAARGNLGAAGQRTLGAQAQDFNQMAENRNYNENVRQYNQEFAYTQGRDKVADQQWEAEFNRIKEQEGIQNALAWANQNLNQQQENRVAANQSSSGGGRSSGGSSSSKPSTEKTIQDINLPRTAATMETYIISNLPGGKNVFGPPSPNQLELVENMILENPNLSEADMVKLYKKFGIPLPE